MLQIEMPPRNCYRYQPVIADAITEVGSLSMDSMLSMVSEHRFAAATSVHGDGLLGDKLQPVRDLWIGGTGRRSRQWEWDPGDRIQEVGAGSQSHGDRSDRDLEDHRSQADEEWRARYLIDDERWKFRMRALKKILDIGLPTMDNDRWAKFQEERRRLLENSSKKTADEEDAPPFVPPARFPVRASRSTSMAGGFFAQTSSSLSNRTPTVRLNS